MFSLTFSSFRVKIIPQSYKGCPKSIFLLRSLLTTNSSFTKGLCKQNTVTSAHFAEKQAPGKVADAGRVAPDSTSICSQTRFFPTAPSSCLRLRRSNRRSRVEHSHPAPHGSDTEQDSAQRPAPKCRESPAPQHARAHSRVLVATGASFPLVFCLGTGWMGPIRDKLFDP